MSFALTTRQIVEEKKNVTRRLGWKFAKVGDRVCACEKCQGIKPGGLVRLKIIEFTGVRRERVDAILTLDNAILEVVREGFAGMSPEQFVAMFCKHMKCRPETEITRIAFKYIGDPE